MKRIVLIAGFESFNADLYRQAAARVSDRCPELDIQVFSDRDLAADPEAIALPSILSSILEVSFILKFKYPML